MGKRPQGRIGKRLKVAKARGLKEFKHGQRAPSKRVDLLGQAGKPRWPRTVRAARAGLTGAAASLALHRLGCCRLAAAAAVVSAQEYAPRRLVCQVSRVRVHLPLRVPRKASSHGAPGKGRGGAAHTTATPHSDPNERLAAISSQRGRLRRSAGEAETRGQLPTGRKKTVGARRVVPPKKAM